MNVTLWGRTVQVQLSTIFEREGETFASVTITMSQMLHEQVKRRDTSNEEEEQYLLPHVHIVQKGKPATKFYLEGVYDDGAVYEARFTYETGTRFSLMRGETLLHAWIADDATE